MSLDEIEKKLQRSKSGSRKKMPKLDSVKRPEESVFREEIEEDEFDGDSDDRFLKRVKSLILGAAVVGVVLVLAIIVFLLNFGRSSDEVEINISAPRDIYRGVPFEVGVQIKNDSGDVLKNAVLNLSETAGLINLDNEENRNVFIETVGDLGSGTLNKTTYKFLAIEGDMPDRKITASLTYFLGGGTRFEAKEIYEVQIKEPAIKLEIKKPEKILSGSSFKFEIGYENISDFDFGVVAIEVEYPQGFKYLSSSLAPSSSNNYWRLGELKARSKGMLEVVGVLEGGSEASFDIPINTYLNFFGKDYKISKEIVNLSITSSPINLQISVNGQKDYIARAGDRLNYTLRYENLSGIALADFVANVTLTGEMFDFNTLETNASFDSSARRLTWDAFREPNLRMVDPETSGNLNFSINLKNQPPIQRLNDKNFYLRVRAEVTSPSVPYYLTASRTRGLANLESKVMGEVLVDAKAFYRDAAAGILNNGVFPPRVNQETEYTIHWLIRNYSTDITGVEIKTFLEPGVFWVGQVKSNVDSVPLWNDETREVKWIIDKINAAKGILNDPVEVIFQVRATPGILEVGGFKSLLGPTDLKATDDFTGLELKSADGGLTTALHDDETIEPEQGRVLP